MMTKRSFIKLALAMAVAFIPGKAKAKGLLDNNREDTVPVMVKESENDSPHLVQIDVDIAPIIVALQNAGIYTLTSCSGHGETDGYILLENAGLTIWKERTKELAYQRYQRDFGRIGQAFYTKHGVK